MIPTFGCIYKMGKEYSYRDVLKLKHNVENRTDMEINFRCFTDDPMLLPTTGAEDGSIYQYTDLEYWAQPLINGWPGWWSVPEIFRLKGPVMVTGLDTVFVSSIDPFFQLALDSKEEDFYMIHAFKRKNVWASGFMVWNGDWSWLYEEFRYKEHAQQFLKGGEQAYTKHKLLERGVNIQGVQDFIDGIYSYKHHVRGKGLPADARGVLFHGRPRPSQVREPWIKKEWKE